MSEDFERLKAAWEVRAGIVPGTPEPKFTKRFFLTSSQNEKDEERITKDPESIYTEGNAFTKAHTEAMAYFNNLCDPRRFNWVDMTFIWY